jgi:isoleucyl-tRNA synthetase
MKRYPEYKQLNLIEIDQAIQQYWKEQDVFKKSLSTRPEEKSFVFYEGPPSSNGMPGIHHVVGRTIKDIFCRYKTLQGYRVDRKGGWDAHGLPVELKVESELGITKEDIGTKVTVEAYNAKCRETVMQYKNVWDDLTNKMGFWLDLENPYITFENNYIESVWWIIKQLFDKGYLYKGYTIQPYSPAAGTGLSSHELNQPGTYKEVTDTTLVGQFQYLSAPEQDKKVKSLLNQEIDLTQLFFLAWTTTPWTLPSNTALAVGKDIRYVFVKTFNPYTALPIVVVLAEALVSKWFKKENEHGDFAAFKEGDKNIPYAIIGTATGDELSGFRYHQLLPFEANAKDHIDGDAWKVIVGDFVSIEDGTGIVHIAPSFGADDNRVAKQHGIGALTMVDKSGKFIDGMGDLSGRYVKNYKDEVDYRSPDVDIAIQLKTANRAFNVQKYAHNYPHCWRTDKPVLYYPLDSWFIAVTKAKSKLIANNKKINWKPESTGNGRFGNWLENIQDWNLSRSRYWGIPLPIWRTEDGAEEKCIGSVEELKAEIEKAKHLQSKEFNFSDLHKPYIDEVVLLSNSGKPMRRELDVIDVWFDSGSMPYAQWHYPFNKTIDLNKVFPADFIAEGVDQTRGWFYTLHAIATLLFDSPAYKNVISNGLVLDKNGVKMSKRLGNVINPFETIGQYGADAVRWYIISNSPPWDNLKFDLEGVEEVRRKFFGTLYNTYSFFALYANIDAYDAPKDFSKIAPSSNELDQWIISKLHSLIEEVTANLEDYEPTKAARQIETFIDRNLSNWFVRLSRRRFWKSENSADKQAAYDTLYECLQTVSQLISPIAPFFSDWLYMNLTGEKTSVHLSAMPVANKLKINIDLEERMESAQDICSLILSLRKKEGIKVRQPLDKVMIPVLQQKAIDQLQKVEPIIKAEVNIKTIQYLTDTTGMFTKMIKPNFKVLGKKMGQKMKSLGNVIATFDQQAIAEIEKNGKISVVLDNEPYDLLLDEVEIATADMPGWLVASENGHTVALDITLTEALIMEGHARELINKIQNFRKDNGFEVTDRIKLTIGNNNVLENVINHYKSYICTEVLANSIDFDGNIQAEKMEINELNIPILIEKVN